MKKILLFLLMLLPVGANEDMVESQEVLTPWCMTAIRRAIGCDPYSKDVDLFLFYYDPLYSLIREGMFDKLREEFFPQIDATFRIPPKGMIYLSTKKTNLDDLVAYYNLSTICATFHVLPGVDNCLAQQNSEKRKSILNKLKSILYDMHRASCNEVTAANMRMGAGEDYPLYVVIQKPGCSSIRLFILAKAGVISRYLRFDMMCVSEETLKSKLGRAKLIFSTYFKSHAGEYEPNQALDDLSFTGFYLTVKSLFSTNGDDIPPPLGILKMYTIGEIEKMLLNDQW